MSSEGENSVFKFLGRSVDLAQEKSYNIVYLLKLSNGQKIKIFSDHSEHRVKRFTSGSRIQRGRRRPCIRLEGDSAGGKKFTVLASM